MNRFHRSLWKLEQHHQPDHNRLIRLLHLAMELGFHLSYNRRIGCLRILNLALSYPIQKKVRLLLQPDLVVVFLCRFPLLQSYCKFQALIQSCRMNLGQPLDRRMFLHQ